MLIRLIDVARDEDVERQRDLAIRTAVAINDGKRPD
jgi:hypothetical protein